MFDLNPDRWLEALEDAETEEEMQERLERNIDNAEWRWENERDLKELEAQ